jgi:hypothetical protein
MLAVFMHHSVHSFKGLCGHFQIILQNLKWETGNTAIRQFVENVLNYAGLADYTINNLMQESIFDRPSNVNHLKNFPAFHGTRRFIAIFRTILQYSLS